MELKKIENPFKKFLRNIVLGIIVLLTFFAIVPVMNNLNNFSVENNEVVAAESTSFKVFLYYNDIDSTTGNIIGRKEMPVDKNGNYVNPVNSNIKYHYLDHEYASEDNILKAGSTVDVYEGEYGDREFTLYSTYGTDYSNKTEVETIACYNKKASFDSTTKVVTFDRENSYGVGDGKLTGNKIFTKLYQDLRKGYEIVYQIHIVLDLSLMLANFSVYGYNIPNGNSGYTISELSSSGGYYKSNNTYVYLTNDANENKDNANNDNRLKSSDTPYKKVILNTTYKAYAASKYDSLTIIGFFKSPEFKKEDLICWGDTITGEQIYANCRVWDNSSNAYKAQKIFILTSNNLRIGVSFENYLNIEARNNTYTWKSDNYKPSYTSSYSVNMGGSLTMPKSTTDLFTDTTFDSSLKCYDKIQGGLGDFEYQDNFVNLNKDGENTYFVYADAQGNLQLFNDKVSKTISILQYSIVYSGTGKSIKFTLQAYHTPTEKNTKIGVENNSVLFKIYNFEDLERFSKELDGGLLNPATSGNYIVRLQNNLGRWTGYNCTSIGKKEDDSHAFRGVFDGNGKTIDEVELLPINVIEEAYGYKFYYGNQFYGEDIEKLTEPNSLSLGTFEYGDYFDYNRFYWDNMYALGADDIIDDYFGLFGFIKGGTIQNLTINSISSQTRTFEFEVVASNSYDPFEGGDLIWKTNLILPSFGIKCGGLCADINQGSVNNVKICSVDLNIGNMYGYPIPGNSEGLQLGLIAGRSVNSTYADVIVDGNMTLHEDMLEVFGRRGTPSVYIGGVYGVGSDFGTGYGNKISACNINYNHNKSDYQKWDEKQAFFGGLVGKEEYKLQIDNTVLTGNRDYSNIWVTEQTFIGGFVGRGKNITIKDSKNDSNMYIANRDTNEWNKDDDYLYVGGFVGATYSSDVIIERSGTTGRIGFTLKDPSASYVPGAKHAYAGMFVGYVSNGCTLTINQSFAFNTHDANFTYITSPGCGLFYGKNAGAVKITNSYSVPYRNENDTGKYYDDNSNEVIIYRGPKDEQENHNREKFAQILRWNWEFVFGGSESIEYKTYGYNSLIQDIGEDFSAPFLLGGVNPVSGSAETIQGNYRNLWIDVSNADVLNSSDTVQVHFEYLTGTPQGFQKSTADDKATIDYDERMLFITSVDGYEVTMPTAVLTVNGYSIPCSYYAYDKEGKDFAYYPGDKVETFGGHKQIYAIWKPSVIVFSPTELYFPGDQIQGYNGAITGAEIEGSVCINDYYDGIFFNMDVPYSVKCFYSLNDGIYNYAYLIAYEGEDRVETIPATVIKNILILQSNEYNTSITPYSLNDLFETNQDTGAIIDYTLTLNTDYKSNAEKIYARNAVTNNADSSVNVGTQLYFHIYKEVKLYYGVLSTYSNYAYYTQYQSIPLFADNLDNLKIKTDFTNIKDYSFINAQSKTIYPFTDIIYNDKTYYLATTYFTKDNGNLSNELVVIYNEEDASDYLSETISVNEIDGNQLFLVYNEPGGVLFEFYENDETNSKIISTLKIPYTKDATKAKVLVNDDNLISNFEFKNVCSKNKTYDEDVEYKNRAFMGWKCYVYGEMGVIYEVILDYQQGFILNFPLTYLQDNITITIKLYPIFVYEDFSSKQYFNFTDTSLKDSDNDGYLEINNEKELIYLSYLTNNPIYDDLGYLKTGKFELANNLDMTKIVNFMPIGKNDKTAFKGSFKGNSFTIKDLKFNALNTIYGDIRLDNESNNNYIYINNSDGVIETNCYIGLFGVVSANTIIQNLNLIDVEYKQPKSVLQREKKDIVKTTIIIGGLVADASYGIEMSNVLISGNLAANDGNANILGGLVGKAKASGSKFIIDSSVSKIKFNTAATSSSYAGIVGTVVDTISSITNEQFRISNCFVLKDDSSTSYNSLFNVIGGNVVFNCSDNSNIKNVNDAENHFNAQKYIYNCYGDNFNEGYLYTLTVFYNTWALGFGTSKPQIVQSNNCYGDLKYGGNDLTNYFWGAESSSNLLDEEKPCNSTKWVKSDNVNNGMPYLKNTGIVNAIFNIDSNEYMFTSQAIPGQNPDVVTYAPNDITNSESEIIKNGYLYSFSRDFFVLDTYTYNDLINSKAYNGSEEILFFNNLQGYNFKNIKDEKNKTYTSYSDISNILVNNNAKYFLQFTAKEQKIEYYILKDGVANKISSDVCDFAQNYLIRKLSSNIPGYSILGYEIYLTAPNGTKVKIDTNDNNKLKLFESGDVNKIYNPDDIMLLSMIDTDTCTICLVAEEGKGLQKIEYQLDFYIPDVYGNFANAKNNIHSNVNGAGIDANIFRTIKYYGDKIDYPNTSALEIMGHNFVNYYVNYDESVIFNYANVISFENVFPNLIEKVSDTKYIIKIYPDYETKIYRIDYERKEFNAKNEIYNKRLDTQYVEFEHTVELLTDSNANININNFNLSKYELTINNPDLNIRGVDFYIDVNEYINNFTVGANITYSIPSDIILTCYYEKEIYSVNLYASNYKGIIENEIIYDNTIYPYENPQTRDSNVYRYFVDNTLKNASEDYVGTINIKYNNIIKLYSIIYEGNRIESVTINGVKDSLTNVTTLEDYISWLENKNIYQNNVDKNINYVLEISSLDNTLTLNNNAGYYEISNASELYSFIKNGTNNNAEYYGILTKNIDITGYNINFNYFYGEIDGQGYSINGYTSFGHKHSLGKAFITYNYGTIKNINFSNVTLISKEAVTNFALMETNNGVLEDINILSGKIVLENQINEVANISVGTLVGENYGKVAKVFVQADMIISVNVLDQFVNDSKLFVGGLVALNKGTIESSSITTNIELTGNIISYVGLVAGQLYYSTNKVVVNDIIINNNAKITSENEKAQIAIVTGMLFDSNSTYSNIVIENIAVYCQYNHLIQPNTNITYNSNSVVSINHFNYELLEQLKEKELISSNFIIAFDYNNTNYAYFVLEGVNNAIVNIEKSFSLNTRTDNLISSVNSANNSSKVIFTNSFEDSGKIIESTKVFVNLENNLAFKATEYSTNKLYYTSNVQLNLQDVTQNFNITRKINNIEFIDDAVQFNQISFINNYLPSLRTVSFEFEAKQIAGVEYVVNFDTNANFSSEEKSGIKNSITVSINGEDIEVNYQYLAQNGVWTESYSINNALAFKMIVQNNDLPKFNDLISWNFDLPYFCSISEFNRINNATPIQMTIDGVTAIVVDENGYDTSRLREYEQENVLGSLNILKGNTSISRESFLLKFDLNKEEENIYSNERANIKFSESWINSNNAQLINEDVLSVLVEVTNENGSANYYSPDIQGIIDYAFEGRHYNFLGFYDEDGNMYYDSNFDKVVTKLAGATTLYLKYEIVEYTVVIDNLGNSVYFPDLASAGYSLNASRKAEKTIAFSEQITLPKVSHLSYANSYNFAGYKLVNALDENDFVMICDANYNIFDNFKELNINYTNKANLEQKLIKIVPVFTFVTYEINFYSTNIEDNYEEYLTHDKTKNNGLEEYDIYNLEEEKYNKVTLKLTISQILNQDFILPIGFKDHHDFIGFKKHNEDIYINFIEDHFESYNLEILINNADFYAIYDIHKINVTIDYFDYNLSENKDYEILEENDLLNVDYDIIDNKIVFVVPYDTTNFVMPSVKLIDTNYRFNKYVIKEDSYASYNINYIFTEDITLHIVCDYKIIYYTKTGQVIDYYKELSNNALGYEFYANYNETITLPLANQVYREGFTLIEYKVDGERIDNLTVTNPTNVEFVYEGNTYTLTIITDGTSFPQNYQHVSPIENYRPASATQQYPEIDVVYETKTSDIAVVLPILEKEGYTFIEYQFEETIVTKNSNVIPVFQQNEYQINIYEGTSLVKSINKKLGEMIGENQNEIYTPTNESGVTFVGLSLTSDGFTKFDMSEALTDVKLDAMPDLQKYPQSIKDGYVVKLNVYAVYIADINVTIEANVNTKILNTSNLVDFVGGEAFNASASFKITADNLLNENFTLPIPQIEENVSNYLTFIGYSTKNESNEKVLVVDASGKLTDNFIYAEYVTLTQEFTNAQFEFKVNANYTECLNLNGFTRYSSYFIKNVVFEAEIGNLPVVNLENYNFDGYYISLTNDLTPSIYDIKISNANGELLEGYTHLTKVYFENNMLKNIVAKYTFDYVNVTITSSNTIIGVVNNNITYTNGTDIQSDDITSIENGYIVKVKKGENILISISINSDAGNFKQFTLLDTNTIISTTPSTIVSNIVTDIEILAEFEPNEFSIEYYDGDEKLNLSPNTYNVESETFDLPNYVKTGYNFEGWYLEKELFTKIETIEKGTKIGDLTVFAKLTPIIIEITIYYNNLNGYINSSKINVAYGNTIENLPIAENVERYYFAGYFTKQDKQGIKVMNNSLSVFVENISLYAHYDEINTVNLEGNGSQVSPYLISSAEEFNIFVQMIESEKYNKNQIYYKLTNNIKLDKKVVISNFKANFDGNGFVIFADNKIDGYNLLNSQGQIEKNITLFGENFGNISNLIFVNNIDSLENVDENAIINIANISSKNNGQISNVIVYFNINTTTNVNFNEFAFNNENVIDATSYASKINNNGIVEEFNNINSNSLHNENIVTPEFINGIYEISTSEELAYILTLNDEIKVKLLNNIDMKGKLFNKISQNISIDGNGYIISNLIVLDETVLFENVIKFEKLAVENLVFINLNTETNLIDNANEIDRSYIVSNISNFKTIINELSTKIENSYFIVSNNQFVVNNNNGQIENVYTNAYLSENEILNQTNVVEFKENDNWSQIEDFMSEVSSDIWFVDRELIMNSQILPAIIGVGNYVYRLIYNENDLSVESNKNINEKMIITKTASDLIFVFEILNEQTNLLDILLNSISDLHNYEAALYRVYATTTLTNDNTIEFKTQLKDYVVTFEVDNEIAGLIEINGEQKIKHILTVLSGTIINAKAIELEGYRFVGWSDNVTVAERSDTILSNITFTAKFEKLIAYNLYTKGEGFENLVIDVVEGVDSIESLGFIPTQESDELDCGYKIYLPISTNIDEILNKLVITKVEHIFDTYLTERIDSTTFNIKPIMKPDYIIVNLNYNVEEVTVFATSQEYSSNYSQLKVIQSITENEISVLRGYELNLEIEFNGCYLTMLTVNSVDQYVDYSIFENNDETINLSLTLLESENNIEITTNEIKLSTKFEYDQDKCGINLKNGIINQDGYVTSKKGTVLGFSLDIEEDKKLDKFEVVNENGAPILDDEGNPIIVETIGDNTYSYKVLQNAIIKIHLIDKEFNINVFISVGGEVVTDKITTEIESEYNQAYKIKLKYKENLNLFVNSNENYRIKSISKSEDGKILSLNKTNILTFNEITKDFDVIVEFEKVSSWLDLDENYKPINFTLTKLRGEGTKTNPYRLTTIQDFLTMAYNVNVSTNNTNHTNYEGKYFRFTQKDLNLDFSRYYFAPIGNDTTSFAGIILGENVTLSGIKIIGGTKVGIFKTLASNGMLKSINVKGEIAGSYLTGSLCGINDGTILGCSNLATITSYNQYISNANIIGGICAVNNGIIDRTYNAGELNGTSVAIGGICAVNNGKVSNIYNVGKIVIENTTTLLEQKSIAGLVASNVGVVEFGYNSSRIVSTNNKNSTNIYGTVNNVSGIVTDIYFNTNLLTSNYGEGKTEEELINQNNDIYDTWDFNNIWYFSKTLVGLPKLQTLYEYSGSIKFVVTFIDIQPSEQLLMIDVTNNETSNYCLMCSNMQNVVTLNNLNEGIYKISLTSLLGVQITQSRPLTIELNEDVSNLVVVNITLSRTQTNGYYGNIFI